MANSLSASPLPSTTATRPFQQDHDVVCRVTLAKEYLADFGRADLPVWSKQAQLLIRQLRKQRRVVVIQQS